MIKNLHKVSIGIALFLSLSTRILAEETPMLDPKTIETVKAFLYDGKGVFTCVSIFPSDKDLSIAIKPERGVFKGSAFFKGMEVLKDVELAPKVYGKIEPGKSFILTFTNKTLSFSGGIANNPHMFMHWGELSPDYPLPGHPFQAQGGSAAVIAGSNICTIE